MSEKKEKVVKLENPFGYACDCAGQAIGRYVRAMGYIEAVKQELLPNHDPLEHALYEVTEAVDEIIGFLIHGGISGVKNGVLCAGAKNDDGTVIETEWE